MPSDLLVLGAGPAGLAAAWRAARSGMDVTVLERSRHVGGLTASFSVSGVRVDHGSHRLHPAIPEAIRSDLATLLGDDLQTRPRNGRLRVADRWVGFPLRPAELARGLPKPMIARIAAETAVAPLRGRGEQNYAAYLRGGLGPTLYRELYEPYAIKLWGLPGDRISAEQARRRVTADTPWKIAGRMIRRRGSGGGRTFLYPRRGFGQISEALAEAAVAAGARIELGTTVEKIECGRTEIVAVSSDQRYEARHAFSTLPLPALGRLVSPRPPAEVEEAAAHLRFRAMVLAYLVHEGGRWTPYDAHYLPGRETPVTRVAEPANYRDSVDDPSDRTVLCLEIPCTPGDETWNASEVEIAELAEAALREVDLPPVRVSDVAVRRLPHVYPVYEIGFEDALAALDHWAAELPSLTTFGRLGLFAHDNTHHALVMAYDAVDALRPEGFDDIAWSSARSRFARHVVED